ncbi:MAG TPA: PQQ-dependent sugar dehydrogenase [Planctomycetaceae bacterium]|nr:PQQ-dependent sugar dehydrogenase [Planctomycetaceae bacterium]
MRHVILLTTVTCLLASALMLRRPADAAPAAKGADGKPVGIAKRVLWTTSKIQGSPEPPAPYRTALAFPKLKFFEPLAMSIIPGTNRFLLAERKGKLFTFENAPNVEKPDLLLDVKYTVYGVAAHPEFKKNGYVYVTCVLNPDENVIDPKGSRLVRFQISKDNPWRLDPQSEKILFEWPMGGHNAGNIVFGPDGYLYLACGDGSGIADEFQTGQDVSDVLASLLRIDVDRPDPGKAYGIPKDNPFVKTPGARPEIWAYGLRQVWKFSFDRKTGDLWAGEVGQDLWESVYKIEKGGNYGWSVNEGSHPFRPERKKGPTPILKPIVEHPHSDFRSLTGGFIYRGSKYKDLIGAYVYGDYDTGKVAALRYEGGKVTEQKELVDTPFRIITFCEDQAGELLFVDFMNGTIYQLVPAPKSEPTAPFPRKLSETGLFASTKDHIPAAGLIPYSVNSELWSDHAVKERFLALPGDSRIEFDTVTYPQPSPGAPAGWRFPDGTVTVKTFSMEMEKGNPASRRRLETRIMHFEQLEGNEEVGDQVWRGYTYVWNDDQADADLLEAKGADRELTIRDAAAPGGVRKQVWHFPSRSECTLCHTMPAKYALGINTLQFNKDHDYGNGVVANQIRTLTHLGIFKTLPATPPEELPHLVSQRDRTQSLDQRVRSYLHSNCSHCHIKWGGGNAEFQLIASLPLDKLGIVNTRPGQGNFGLNDPRILVPADPDRSMIYHRMTKLGLGRMPHVASSVIDDEATKLVREWISSLPKGK